MSAPPTLTDRDLELIEVALESAVSAVGSGFSRPDQDDMNSLGAEYRQALDKITRLREAR